MEPLDGRIEDHVTGSPAARPTRVNAIRCHTGRTTDANSSRAYSGTTVPPFESPVFATLKPYSVLSLAGAEGTVRARR